MRRVILLLLAASAVSPVGCNWLKSAGGTKKEKDLPPVDSKQRQPAEFVGYLNRQAGYLNTVRYDDLDLRVTVPGQWIPGLGNGLLVCGKPNNFRMQAKGPVGGTQLDVGSNTNEMWMYVKPSDPQYLFCSHADFAKVQDSLPVKFEPAWVLQALGMTTYEANRDYTVETDTARRAYYLKYPDTTATGERVLKVTEFAADSMNQSEPQVRRHLVLTADAKKVIAVATVKKVAEQRVGADAVTGGPAIVQVPTEVALEWPQQNVKMDLTLGRIKVNESMTPADFDNLFRRPNSINSAQPVNLADYVTPNRGGGVSRGALPDDRRTGRR